MVCEGVWGYVKGEGEGWRGWGLEVGKGGGGCGLDWTGLDWSLRVFGGMLGGARANMRE